VADTQRISSKPSLLFYVVLHQIGRSGFETARVDDGEGLV